MPAYMALFSVGRSVGDRFHFVRRKTWRSGLVQSEPRATRSRAA